MKTFFTRIQKKTKRIIANESNWKKTKGTKKQKMKSKHNLALCSLYTKHDNEQNSRSGRTKKETKKKQNLFTDLQIVRQRNAK